MKRIIFTFLYYNGKFILSRNFRRQSIGDYNWLFKNYKLSRISYGLDELMILNISDNHDYDQEFISIIEHISKICFIPLTVGGKINTLFIAEKYFKAGADKLFINNLIFNSPKTCQKLIKVFGSQAIMGGINFSLVEEKHIVLKSDGKSIHNEFFKDHINYLLDINIGEVLLQSIDNDGTGKGLDLSILTSIPYNFPLPLILMGGIGKQEHIIEGLLEKKIDAVSSANILNFIGTSLLKVRESAINVGISLPDFN